MATVLGVPALVFDVTLRRVGGAANNNSKPVVASNLDETGFALLDETLRHHRYAALFKPGVRGAKRWVPAEGRLAARREDAQPGVRLLRGRGTTNVISDRFVHRAMHSMSVS